MNEPGQFSGVGARVKPQLDRRTFLGLLAAGAAAGATGGLRAAESAGRRSFQFSAFSKPFRHLGVDETAEFVERVGWDGIELPVRARSSHLNLARAEEDLPRMVEALGRRGKRVFMITTDIVAPSADAERLLRVAAGLGIRKYRLGALHYEADKPPLAQLEGWKPQLKELADLNAELGMQGGLQNHSGARYVGAPVWDIHELVRDLDPAHLGVCFDIGHATVEGGNSWRLHARLMEPYFVAVYVKDFTWQRVDGEWRTVWCPLGRGMVSKSFLQNLSSTNYTGFINQHHEYDGAEGDTLFENCRRDLETLKEWVRS